MARQPNLRTTEDQAIVSGPCIAGRKTAGSGGMEELSGADAVALLPAATASVDGKMTKEQAAAVDRAMLETDNLVINLMPISASGSVETYMDTGDNYSRHGCKSMGGTSTMAQIRFAPIILPANINSSYPVTITFIMSSSTGNGNDLTLLLLYGYSIINTAFVSMSVIEYFNTNFTNSSRRYWQLSFDIPYSAGKDFLTINLMRNSKTYTITSVDQATKKFVISTGASTSEIIPGGHIEVRSSTGNDGTYTVTSVTSSGGVSVFVSESIPSAVAGGTIDLRDNFDSDIYYHAATATIHRS